MTTPVSYADQSSGRGVRRPKHIGWVQQKIRAFTTPQDKIKGGLEATGQYSYNLLGFLLDNGLLTDILNPLRTNLCRKSHSLRKPKLTG